MGIKNNYKNEAHVLWLIPYGKKHSLGIFFDVCEDHPAYAGNTF
jgi:hypothetical protein